MSRQGKASTSFTIGHVVRHALPEGACGVIEAHKQPPQVVSRSGLSALLS